MRSWRFNSSATKAFLQDRARCSGERGAASIRCQPWPSHNRAVRPIETDLVLPVNTEAKESARIKQAPATQCGKEEITLAIRQLLGSFVTGIRYVR